MANSITNLNGNGLVGATADPVSGSTNEPKSDFMKTTDGMGFMAIMNMYWMSQIGQAQDRAKAAVDNQQVISEKYRTFQSYKGKLDIAIADLSTQNGGTWTMPTDMADFFRTNNVGKSFTDHDTPGYQWKLEELKALNVDVDTRGESFGDMNTELSMKTQAAFANYTGAIEGCKGNISKNGDLLQKIADATYR